MTLSTRNASRRRIVLLAPLLCEVPARFAQSRTNARDHAALLADMQRFRGRVYLQDGAIRKDQLTRNGRHRVVVDELSWHLLLLGGDGRVTGCSRYLSHRKPVSFSDLTLRKAALASCPRWGKRLRLAVAREVRAAQRKRVPYVEVGGWAMHEEVRHTTEALKVALSTYSLATLLGGCIGITTATRRHNSSCILRRIGGRSLELDGEELPSYFDPQYQCDMEILRFDSSLPNPRYQGLIDRISDELVDVPVICARDEAEEFGNPLRMPVSLWPGLALSPAM